MEASSSLASSMKIARNSGSGSRGFGDDSARMCGRFAFSGVSRNRVGVPSVVSRRLAALRRLDGERTGVHAGVSRQARWHNAGVQGLQGAETSFGVVEHVPGIARARSAPFPCSTRG